MWLWRTNEACIRPSKIQRRTSSLLQTVAFLSIINSFQGGGDMLCGRCHDIFEGDLERCGETGWRRWNRDSWDLKRISNQEGCLSAISYGKILP
jgi:hypothetical protein